MRLYEFASADPTLTSLVALVNQIRYDLDNNKLDTDVTVDDFLNYFARFGVPLDKKDLYDLYDKAPMKDIISNIKDGKIIFRGHEPDSEESPDEQKKIVKQMANKAKN